MRTYIGRSQKDGKPFIRILLGYQVEDSIYCDTHGEYFYDLAEDDDFAFHIFLGDVFPKDWRCVICSSPLSLSDPYGRM